MRTDDPHSVQLEELTQVAYRLGVVFGREAETAQSHERRVQFFNLFDRCFFSYRVALALQLRLIREAKTRPMAEREDERAEVLERDPPDRDDSEDRPERYDERDRETERASLPILLRTLEGVAADAEALPGPRPAELPTLRELLAKVKGSPAQAPRRPASPALRSRLTGSAAPLTLERPSLNAARPKRRATGPP